ncbi:MAG: LptA/OstA family protein [PVC group bacterium]
MSRPGRDGGSRRRVIALLLAAGTVLAGVGACGSPAARGPSGGAAAGPWSPPGLDRAAGLADSAWPGAPTPPEYAGEIPGPAPAFTPSATVPPGIVTPSPRPVPTPLPAIVCEGDRVRYRDSGKTIVAEGNVRIGYKNMELTADRVTVYIDRKEAYAEGNVTLTQWNNVITTDKIRYDFVKEQGIMSPGSGYYAPWYGRSETVEAEGREKITFLEGKASTCDEDEPHYRIEAKKLIIYPDDKLVGYNNVVYVGSVPVFWLPYYRKTLKDNCRGFFFYPGFRNTWGFFFLSGYHWCVPGLQTTFHLDYRYRRGLAYGLDGLFNIDSSGWGEWQTYYLKDQRYENAAGEISTRERYLIELEYRQNLVYRVGGNLSLHYMSDDTVRKDFFRREYDADSQPESYLFLDRRWQDITLSLEFKPRLNEFEKVTEKLPEAKLQVQEFQIWESDFYYQGSNSFANFKKKFPDEASPRYASGRFDTFHQLSYSRKFFGWLNFYPAVSLRGDFYSRGPGKTDTASSSAAAAASAAPTPKPSPSPAPPDQRDFWREVFAYSVGVSTDIYGIYPAARSDWLEIDKLRHVITPSVDYIFINNPSVYYEDIYQFDKIDKIKRANYFDLTLRNQLQTKRYRKRSEESWTLVDLILSTPLYAKPDRDNSGRLMGDLDTHLEVTPFSSIGIDLDNIYNTYDNRFIENTLDIWVKPEDDWWVTFSHYYRQKKDRNEVGAEVYLRINPLWAFKIYGRYDTVAGRLNEESFTIYRDLHCWSSYLRFERREDENEYSVFLALWIKAFEKSPLNLSN